MNTLGIIPARYASSRFPGKPLVMIHGKSMIQRVYEQAKKCESLSAVVVATDDDRIYKHVKSFGGEVKMTNENHASGTERCAEIVSSYEKEVEVVVNIQGDEPYISPKQIQLVCDCFAEPNVQIATLKKRIHLYDELTNPNRPKVTVDDSGIATMFSREVIPALGETPNPSWMEKQYYFKHIGLYGYRADVLLEIAQLEPTPLEIKEQLEQLRWLENGYKIKVAETNDEAIAIDTPEDLEKLIQKS